MLGVVGSSLKIAKFEPTTPNTSLNMSQQGGQTRATCCTQQCCDMLRWHVALACCDRLAPAKRSRHVNATYRNIVGRNMLRAFGHRVAMCCDMLGVVGSGLKMVKFEPTTPNTSQQGGQTPSENWPKRQGKAPVEKKNPAHAGVTHHPWAIYFEPDMLQTPKWKHWNGFSFGKKKKKTFCLPCEE